MNTIAFVAAVLVLALVIMAKLPGVEHLVRPVIDLLFSAIKVFADGAFGWTVYITKALWFSHVEVLQHLLLSPEALDPTYAIRESADPNVGSVPTPE